MTTARRSSTAPNPQDSERPGIYVGYQDDFYTKGCFSVTDPDYLAVKQAGDRHLMTEAMVVRRAMKAEMGDHAVALQVEDMVGALDTQVFTITVLAHNPGTSLVYLPVVLGTDRSKGDDLPS